MASGGARARSGPAADPGSLRSAKRDWVRLDPAGYQGEIPAFPLDDSSSAEAAMWDELWRKPQASQWAALGMRFQVAAYVRAFLESVQPEASAGLKTAVLRMETELGLSVSGLHGNGWLIEASDPEETPKAKRSSSGARSRMRLINGGS